MAATKKKSDPVTQNFESNIKKLEAILQRMENSDISLDESLRAFEQGVKLASEAQSALAAAEQRVRLLLEKDGEAVTQSFTLDDQGQ